MTGRRPPRPACRSDPASSELAHHNGLWPFNRQGPIGFVTETGVGAASRWNTLRALRVLDWFRGRDAGVVTHATVGGDGCGDDPASWFTDAPYRPSDEPPAPPLTLADLPAAREGVLNGS